MAYEWNGVAGQPATKGGEFSWDFLATFDVKQTDAAIQYIKEHAKSDKPFFMDVNFMKTHNPNNPAPQFAGKTRLGRYSDSMLELDDNIGRIMDAIRAEAPNMAWPDSQCGWNRRDLQPHQNPDNPRPNLDFKKPLNTKGVWRTDPRCEDSDENLVKRAGRFIRDAVCNLHLPGGYKTKKTTRKSNQSNRLYVTHRIEPKLPPPQIMITNYEPKYGRTH